MSSCTNSLFKKGRQLLILFFISKEKHFNEQNIFCEGTFRFVNYVWYLEHALISIYSSLFCHPCLPTKVVIFFKVIIDWLNLHYFNSNHGWLFLRRPLIVNHYQYKILSTSEVLVHYQYKILSRCTGVHNQYKILSTTGVLEHVKLH